MAYENNTKIAKGTKVEIVFYQFVVQILYRQDKRQEVYFYLFVQQKKFSVNTVHDTFEEKY